MTRRDHHWARDIASTSRILSSVHGRRAVAPGSSTEKAVRIDRRAVLICSKWRAVSKTILMASV